MKKQIIILLILAVTCSLAMSLVNAADPEIVHPGGVENTNINVSFNGNQFSDAEKSQFMAGANEWTNAAIRLRTDRVPRFYQTNTYNEVNGVSVKKGPIDRTVVANCWKTGNGYSIDYSRITFNTENFAFTTDLSQAGKYDNGKPVFDLQSIAVHELGHSLGLGHSSHAESVVYSTSNSNKPIRMVSVHDEYSFYQIYKSQILNAIYDNSNNTSTLSTENEENYLHLRNVSEDTLNSTYEEAYDLEMTMCILYEPLTDTEMIDRSDLIIEGRVKEILPSQWTTLSGKAPSLSNIDDIDENTLFHYVVVEVDGVYKGEVKTDTILIRKMGGTSDNVRLTTTVPDYYENEKVIIYLVEEGFDESGSIFYTQVNEEGQIFVVDDNLGVNGLGHKVDLQKDVVEKIEESSSV